MISSIKSRILTVCTLFIVLTVTVTAYAANNEMIVKAGESISRDVLTANQTVKNSGVIKGDLISAAQSIISDGNIEGDLLCAAGDIRVTGKIDGDIRSAGENISISGNVGKNANLFAKAVELEDTSSIGGNVVAFARNVNLNGKISGYTRLNAEKITLNGEILGDIDINMDINEHDNKEIKLTVLPGTIIYGKLTFKGINEAEIASDAKIGSYEWIKPVIEPKKSESQAYVIFKKLIRTIFKMIVYFLIAMLLYKLFPSLFMRQGDYILKKPINVIGVGIVTILAILAVMVIFAISILLSILIMSPAILVLFGSLTASLYIGLFYFSLMPIAFLVGNIVLKDKGTVKYKFGTGLIIVTIGLFIIDIMSKVPIVGFVFSLLYSIMILAIAILGIGSLMYILRDIVLALRGIKNIM